MRAGEELFASLSDADRLRWQRRLNVYVVALALLGAVVVLAWQGGLLPAISSGLPGRLTLLLLGALPALAMAIVLRVAAGPRVDFSAAVQARLAHLRRLPRLLEGGAYEVVDDEAVVTGRLAGLGVTITCWARPDRLPPGADETLTHLDVPHGLDCTLERQVTPPDGAPDAPDPRLRVVHGRLPTPPPALVTGLLQLFDDFQASRIVLEPGGLIVHEPALEPLLVADRQRARLAHLAEVARALAASAAGRSARRLASGPPAAPPAVAVSRRDGPEARCPYCHAEVAGHERRDCPTCRAPHHAACLVEHGGCSIPGCRAGPSADRMRQR